MNNIRVDTDLMQFLPDWYKEIQDYQQIINAESEQAMNAYSLLQKVHGNFYFREMTEETVYEWEKILGILPNPETETLEFRRLRALNRISAKPPFSIRALKERLNTLIGAGAYQVIVDGKNYTLYVESSAENQAYAIEVAYTVESMKPAHIVYINTPLLRDSMLVNEVILSREVTYNYRLGGWGLGLNAFATDGTNEVRKMATTSSIREGYLNDTTEAAMDLISKARINGSIVKTSITKTRSDNQMTVEYGVTTSDTSLVQKVELLDASNNVLSSANVYVPITQNAVMKHIITVQEGVN